jgi:hypothetical protein
MNALPLEQAGDGSAVNQLARQVGGAVGVAVLGSVFATVFSTRVAPLLLRAPATVAHDAAHSAGAAETFAKTLPLKQAAVALIGIHSAFVAGARTAMIAAGLFCLAAIAVVLRGMRTPVPAAAPVPVAHVDSPDLATPEGA